MSLSSICFLGSKVCGKDGFVSGPVTRRQNIDLDSLHKDLHPERARDELLAPGNVIKDQDKGPAVVVSKVSKKTGWFERLNRCCLDHENCDKLIPAKEQRYGYTNEREYTIYDCKCDDGFAECLKYADSYTADAVGDLYFNILKMPCINFGDGSVNVTTGSEGIVAKVDKIIEDRIKEKLATKPTTKPTENPTPKGRTEEGAKVGGPSNTEEGERRSDTDNAIERQAKHFNKQNH